MLMRADRRNTLRYCAHRFELSGETRGMEKSFEMSTKALRGLATRAGQYWRWIDRVGHSANHNFGFLDNFLSIFAGISIAVATTEWLGGHPQIILVILIFAGMTSTAIVIAMNQAEFLWRMPFNLLAIISAYAAVPATMWASAHDLAPHELKLLALPAGVMAWVLIRELAIILLNVIDDLKRRRTRSS
jgi:hypothetical protein